MVLMTGIRLLGVASGDLLELGGDEQPEHDGHQHDHYDPAEVLRERELPADQDPQDEPELPHEVCRGELKRERRRRRGALLKQRFGDRDRGVGAGGRSGAESRGQRDRARAATR
jgi:hypothetical protein